MLTPKVYRARDGRGPLTLRIFARAARRGIDLKRLLAADVRCSWRVGYRLLERFVLAGYERRFVRELLRARANLWLFRCSQRAFCGDFVVVDMSEPRAGRRGAQVIELKLGKPLIVGRGPRSVQLANHRRALREIAERTGVIAPGAPCALLSGDPLAVIAWSHGRRR